MTTPRQCPTCAESPTVRLAAYGEFFATRGLARSIRARAATFLAMHPEERVILDFTGVQAATGGFADELVAVLAATHPGRVRVCGASGGLADTIQVALTRRDITADVHTTDEETP